MPWPETYTEIETLPRKEGAPSKYETFEVSLRCGIYTEMEAAKERMDSNRILKSP